MTITVAEAGKRPNQNKIMEKTHKIEPRQREALVDMLRDAKLREREDLQNSNGVVESDVIRELAIEQGAGKILKEIEELYPKIKELEARNGKLDCDLQDLGFRINGSQIALHYGASNLLHQELRDIMKKRRAPIEEKLKKYDLAIADIWTVDTNADASKVIEGLI